MVAGVMMPAMADRCMGRWAAEALPRPIQIGPKRPRFSAIASGSAQHLFRLSQVNRRSVVVSVVLAMAATAPRSPAAVAGANRDPQASLEAPWGFQARSVARWLWRCRPSGDCSQQIRRLGSDSIATDLIGSDLSRTDLIGTDSIGTVGLLPSRISSDLGLLQLHPDQIRAPKPSSA